MSISSEAKKEVERLLQQGQKIEAVRYLQNAFNISEPDAQSLTDVVEVELRSKGLAISSSSEALPGGLKEQVWQLIQANKKVQAYNLVKQELSMSLKDAVLVVEEIHKEYDPGYKPVRLGGGCFRTGAKVISVIFGIIAFLFLGMAAIVYFVQESTIKNSDLTSGKVIELRHTGDGSAPVIAYTWQGKDRRYSPDMYSTPPAYTVGEEVPLYVDRNDPSQIVINTFTDRWLPVVVSGGIGAFFLLLTIIFYRAGKTRQIKPQYL